MPIRVRAIEADELVEWVQALHVAFHVDRVDTAPHDAAFRRDVMGHDPRRMLAALDDHDRIAGTLFGFTAQLTVPGGRCLSANAITAATVLPTHRRRGLLTRLLSAELIAARERGELASILVAAEYPIYGRFGFGPATEQATYTLDTRAATFKRSPLGSVELVAPETLREVAPGLFDQFRRAQPGQIDRADILWDLLVGLREAPWSPITLPVRCGVFRAPDGDVEGYVVYRVDGTWNGRLPTGKLEVVELIACSADAYLGLWRYCCEIDLVRQVTAGIRCVDEPLTWLLDNPRAALQQTLRSDLLWLRPLDVAGLLSARRYLSEGRIVLDVNDPLGLCGGRFALEGGPHGAVCRATDQSADLSLSAQALGAITLGGLSLTLLADAGAIEELRPGALDMGERLFRWPVAPWCSTFF